MAPALFRRLPHKKRKNTDSSPDYAQMLARHDEQFQGIAVLHLYLVRLAALACDCAYFTAVAGVRHAIELRLVVERHPIPDMVFAHDLRDGEFAQRHGTIF